MLIVRILIELPETHEQSVDVRRTRSGSTPRNGPGTPVPGLVFLLFDIGVLIAHNASA